MRKLFIIMFCVFSLASFAAAEVGIGLKVGMGQDDDNLKATFLSDPNNYSSDESKGIGGVELIWQQQVEQESILGVKLGLDIYDKLKYSDLAANDEMNVDGYKIPVTVFYKYAPSEMPLNFWVGPGVTLACSDWEYNYHPTAFSAEKNKRQIFPHIKAGVEFRPYKNFGLGLDVGYNYAKEFKAWSYKRDIGGFEGALAARFYFL